jgi:hypothetical protein
MKTIATENPFILYVLHERLYDKLILSYTEHTVVSLL